MTLLVAGVALLLAQGTQPLRKADLIRLLGTGAMSKPAIAALVRRNCVTFRPSDHDRADLRVAGADVAVLGAIDECLQKRAAARPAPGPVAAAPPPPPAAPAAPPARPPTARRPPPRRPAIPATAPPLRVVASQQVTALAGSDATVAVQAYRGSVPQPGVALLLRGASNIPGGLTRDPVVVTDLQGVATFRILSGISPGTYRLTVATAGGAPLGPGSEIALVTTPQAQAAPPPPPPPPPRAPSEEQTDFVRGADQRGAAGTALPQPLVLAVRDAAGGPLAGRAVTLAATNATVTPGAALSDSSGQVRVRVALGERAGPAVVSAKVAGFTRTATLRVDAGPPQQLLVERNGALVVGSVSVRSRDTVVLRVAARDAYGNHTGLEDFTAASTNNRLGLQAVVAGDSQGVVTLEPRRSGFGEVQVSGSGLKVRVAVDIELPTVATSPWAIGARGASLAANNPWVDLAGVTSISGGSGGVYVRRMIAPAAGLSLAVGGTGGSVNVERSTTTTSVTLLEGFGRVELAPLVRSPVSPVLSLGVGAYRLKSSDNGQTLYHTNTFWSGGVGADVRLSPRVTLELRAEREWMRDANFGHVATFWPIGVGLRLGL